MAWGLSLLLLLHFLRKKSEEEKNLRYKKILVVLFWKVKLFCKDISPPSPKNNYKFLLSFLEILMIYKTSFAVMNKRKLKILQKKNEIINNIWLKNSYRKKNLYKNMSWFKKKWKLIKRYSWLYYANVNANIYIQTCESKIKRIFDLWNYDIFFCFVIFFSFAHQLLTLGQI